MRSGHLFAAICFSAALKRPSILVYGEQPADFIRRSFLPQPMNFVPILAPNLPHLLSMAVDEAAEGTAAATALVKCFEAEISGEYPGYMLSVLKDNPRAIRFYKKLGLRVVVDAFPRTMLLQKDFAASDDTVPR